MGRDLEERFEDGFGFLEPLKMGDGLGRFEDELEIFGDLSGPGFDGCGGGEAIEAAVDFDGGEVAGVEGEEVGGGEVPGVEGGFPLFVAIAAGADE